MTNYISACHGAGNCVQVALLATGGVSVRDSKTGRTLEFTGVEWDEFLAAAKQGRFDRDRLGATGRCRNTSCSKWGQVVGLMRSVFAGAPCADCGCQVEAVEGVGL